MSNNVVYWPHEPPEDAVVLVRATGTINIEKVRSALDEVEIPYTMGGPRKDDVTFYVPHNRLQDARREVRARVR